MISAQTIPNCRQILVGLARSANPHRVTYSELMRRLGIARQEIKDVLNPIYDAERRAGRPDLTLIVRYAGSRYGLYHSGGATPQTKKVASARDRQGYKAELKRVYATSGGTPRGAFKRWLES